MCNMIKTVNPIIVYFRERSRVPRESGFFLTRLYLLLLQLSLEIDNSLESDTYMSLDTWYPPWQWSSAQ